MPFQRLRFELHSLLSRFRDDRSGNVAIIFALSLIPLIAAVGTAVDYSRISADKAKMQSALDATALGMAKEASQGASTAQLNADSLSYFKAIYNRPDVKNIKVAANFSTTNGTALTVSGTLDVPTVFMGLFGINTVQLRDSSTTRWGSHRLRVALVLDNTGSMMQSGKMSALKTATHNLLTQLQTAARSPGDVYVSIIPFVKDVNFDPGNNNAAWIDWTDWDKANGTCKSGSWNQHYNGTRDEQSSCSGSWAPDPRSSWNGCVADRGDTTGPDTGNYDTNVDAPKASEPATKFAADQYSRCPQTAMGLSDDWSAMNTLVDNMMPAGTTNQNIGLDAGWMSLVGGGPFTVPSEDPNYQYEHIIILLTDGLNTQNRWWGNGFSVEPRIDTRQAMTCDNIKASNVTLYTIQVDTGGDPKSTLLEDCASSSKDFYLLTSADQILTTFQKIGTEVSQLYIAK